MWKEWYLNPASSGSDVYSTKRYEAAARMYLCYIQCIIIYIIQSYSNKDCTMPFFLIWLHINISIIILNSAKYISWSVYHEAGYYTDYVVTCRKHRNVKSYIIHNQPGNTLLEITMNFTLYNCKITRCNLINNVNSYQTRDWKKINSCKITLNSWQRKSQSLLKDYQLMF